MVEVEERKEKLPSFEEFEKAVKQYRQAPAKYFFPRATNLLKTHNRILWEQDKDLDAKALLDLNSSKPIVELYREAKRNPAYRAAILKIINLSVTS